MLHAFGVGALAGLAWGVVARGFMRLLAEVPEFSWGGTLGIVGIATITGAGVGLVRQARGEGRTAWWRLAALPFVLLFTGTGVVLLPGVLGIAAVLRGGWLLRVVGVLLLGVSCWGVVAESGGVPTGRQLLGLAVAFGCLAVEGWAAGEVVRRWAVTTAAAPGVGPDAAVLPA